MPRLPSRPVPGHSMMKKLQRKRGKAASAYAAPDPEERVGLVVTDTTSTANNDTNDGYCYASANAGIGWQRLFLVLLAGGLMLFLWESLEVDSQTGDVELKIYSGSNSGTGSGTPSSAPPTMVPTTSPTTTPTTAAASGSSSSDEEEEVAAMAEGEQPQQQQQEDEEAAGEEPASTATESEGEGTTTDTTTTDTSTQPEDLTSDEGDPQQQPETPGDDNDTDNEMTPEEKELKKQTIQEEWHQNIDDDFAEVWTEPDPDELQGLNQNNYDGTTTDSDAAGGGADESYHEGGDNAQGADNADAEVGHNADVEGGHNADVEGIDINDAGGGDYNDAGADNNGVEGGGDNADAQGGDNADAQDGNSNDAGDTNDAGGDNNDVQGGNNNDAAESSTEPDTAEVPHLDTASPMEPATPADEITAENNNNSNNNKDVDCPNACARKPPNKDVPNNIQDRPFAGQDLTQSKIMYERLTHFRQLWIDTRLKPDYGEEFYDDIFEPMMDDGNNSTKRMHVGDQLAFKEPSALKPGQEKLRHGIGHRRMVQKYMIKLIQLQLNMLEEQRLDYNPYCLQECLAYVALLEKAGTSSSSNNSTNIYTKENTTAPEAGLYGKFVWVTGGHSASAGHGNFFRESYTANLGRDIQPILKEIGLDFIVRNYAMGGTDSGEEVALCANSIFGRDVDSISWDYGMTDGNDRYKMALYAYRAARLALVKDSVTQPGNVRHRPSLIAIHEGSDRIELLEIMQNLGMTVLGMDMSFEKNTVYAGFPDMFGMTDAQIEALPPYIRYFKCQDQVETGDPGCKDHKYNLTMCETRKAQASWHPGFKYHALVGHMMAFTVLEVVSQALEKMVNDEPAQPETPEEKQSRLMKMLTELNAREQMDYERIFNTELPPTFFEYFDSSLWSGDAREANKEAMKDFLSFEMLVKEPSFCHTAMLPAEVRYKGLLTDNFEEAGTAVDQHFEHAIFLSKVQSDEAPSGKSGDGVPVTDARPERQDQMVLVSKDDEWEICPEETNADHKDFFYISTEESWRKLTIPNDAEKAYYQEFDALKSNGWFFVCLATCDWNNCAHGDVRKTILNGTMDAGEFGQVEMEVNNVKVTDLKCMNKCCALMHDDADPVQRFKWAPNGEGRYEFRTRMSNATEYGYARFSSFILM